ncbi:MAG TPA: cobalamin biosynthesis protein, partial [Methanosarcina sp.]|nr:cobalamin biosynthesis protein [Methanosarcina sp.]
MIIGIGTRKGITKEEVIEAVKQALDEYDLSLNEVTAFASAKLKEEEEGLREAGEILGIKVNFLPDEILNSYNPPSSSQASRFGLK